MDDDARRPPEGDEPYGLDDLIADQRRQTRIVLAVFLLAMLYFVLRTLLGGGAPEAPPPAQEPGPVTAPR